MGNPTMGQSRGVIDVSRSPYVRLRSIPMQDTELTDGFWADRFDLCADKMTPALKQAMLGKGSAKLNRIKFMAGLTDENPGGVPWGDGDCYKWIETMAHVYNLNKNLDLDQQMDEWIEIVGKAQEEDGYISTNIGHDKQGRFKNPSDHEMYNMGHLLTAACIHYRVTGKKSFLHIAEKLADYMVRQWTPNPPELVNFPWNPSVYMGLIEMYRSTGNRDYLEVAEIMINNRGAYPKPGGPHWGGGTDQTQDFVPIREETLAVGHAVTGNYLYCGVADLYAETGEKALLDALERIWSDICERKTDIICAVAMGDDNSPRPQGGSLHEAFASKPYQQPNMYNETCANIGTGMFNYRMLLLTGDAKYADWTERMMYNALNSAVDLEGEKWFYCNPLSWDGTPGDMELASGDDTGVITTGHHTGVRWETNNCYCCPPSVARTTAKLHNWFYAVSDDGALWVSFYGGNRLSTTLVDGSEIALSQTTDYPWDGRVEITIDAVGSEPLPMHFRIPGWTANPAVSVNGEAHTGDIELGSYLKIERTWSAGDTVVLDFPMPIRLMEANPKVTKLRNKVAVMRGPMVYCLELPKREGGEETWNNGVFLPESIELRPEYRSDLLGGVTVLKGNALTLAGCENFIKDNPGAREPSTVAGGPLYQPLKPRDANDATEGTVEVSLIPYYTWANRGLAYMDVWIPLAEEVRLLNHLAASGVSVAKPVARQDGRYVSRLEAPEGTRYAVLFEAARGVAGDEGNHSRIEAFGEMVGRMHQAADQMHEPYRRSHLDMHHLVDDNLPAIASLMAHRGADFSLIGRIADECKSRISQLLPKSKPEYGICHGDLHGGDVCYDENHKPALFDFDSSGCGWRALDIGVFLASDDWMDITREAEERRRRRLASFVEGYSGVRTLTEHELSAVQLGPPIRHIYLMGFVLRYTATWEGEHWANDHFIDWHMTWFSHWAERPLT